MATTKTTERLELVTHRRPVVGTRPTKRLRHQGQIPGVIYGKTTSPIAVAMDRASLAHILHSKAGEHALVELRLEGDKPWESPAVVKAIQHDPVDGHVVHVDFHAIALTERIRVKVPVVLKGDSIGVKQEGGILEQFLREVEVECLPTHIPEYVAVDITHLHIGDTVHVRDLPPLPQAKLLSDPAGVLTAVLQPRAEKVEEAAAAAAEPEVIREKKPEAEGAEAADAKGAASEVKEAKNVSEAKDGRSQVPSATGTL